MRKSPRCQTIARFFDLEVLRERSDILLARSVTRNSPRSTRSSNCTLWARSPNTLVISRTRVTRSHFRRRLVVIAFMVCLRLLLYRQMLTLTPSSLPVYVSGTRHPGSVDGDVGLQYWTCAHYASIQVSGLSKGICRGLSYGRKP